ncbi:uncharacterized protein LOC110419862 [Herrania umbratica]|uniref:Uncharacterized protein LOC110419862 n=1 Tax=Herrania umbratica TaxID=108875 RepID=A0A6J1ANU2_9ROSI|nr:uncharacterized protein LOC110419862 [Herrania umbratica]
MASEAEVAVFTDTNLGTHLAVAVSPDTTVGDFQRKLERMHCSCFPKLGKIEVYALMVKRKSCFYHLPLSMPIKYAFEHQEGTWFLHIEARILKASDGPCLSNFAAPEVGDHKCDGNHLTNSLVQNIGQVAMISGDAAERDLSSMTKYPTNMSLREISAAGIINGCLLNCSGVSKHANSPITGRTIQSLPEDQPRTKADDCCSSIQIGDSRRFMVRTPPKQSLFLLPTAQMTGTPREKFVDSEVGKRIIIASNNIRISANKQRPTTPLSRFRDGKLLRYKNLSLAKFLVFEISDSDD